MNTPHSKKLFQKITGVVFSTLHHVLRICRSCCNYFSCSLSPGEYNSYNQSISPDVPIIFYRTGKTFFQFHPKVTWKISTFLRTPLKCPPIKSRCTQSIENIFAKKCPMNFIQSASELFIDQLENALSTIFIRHMKKTLSQFFIRGSL